MKTAAPATYSTRHVTACTGVSARQLQWWDETGVVSPMKRSHRRNWSAEDLLLVRMVAGMRARGVSLEQCRGAVALARRVGPPNGWIVSSASFVAFAETPEKLAALFDEVASAPARVVRFEAAKPAAPARRAGREERAA